LLVLFIALFGQINGNYGTWLSASLALMAVGVCMYAWREYTGKPEGIKNNHVWHRALTNRGLWAWIVGVVLTGFYLVLYFRAEYLGLGVGGAANTGLIALFDPLSQLLKNQPASQWFVYGTLYTLAILIFGVKFLLKYRHNRYQQFRTLSVMFFQLGFAFLIPEILMRLNYPYNNFVNMWPLNYYFFDGWNITALTTSGKVGMFMFVWGILMILVISPVLRADLFLWQTLVLLVGMWLWRLGRDCGRPVSSPFRQITKCLESRTLDDTRCLGFCHCDDFNGLDF